MGPGSRRCSAFSFSNTAMQDEEPIEIPLTDELDLHTFRASEVKELLIDYLEEAQRMRFESVRIVHGKGTGALRELVHAQLKKHPEVIRFELCGGAEGSWGATRAFLKPANESL